MSNFIDPADVWTFNKDHDIIRMPGAIRIYKIHSITFDSQGFHAFVYLDGTNQKYMLDCPDGRFDIEYFEPSPEDVERNGPENFHPFNIYHLYEVHISTAYGTD